MWNQQWHTNFCVAYTRNPEFLQVSIEIEYNGVIFNKVIFGEDQYQCSTRGPFEWGASSDNILSNTPAHHQCPLQHQTAWRRTILKQWQLQNEMKPVITWSAAPTKQEIAEKKRWRNSTVIILERRRLPHYNIKCLDCVMWWVPLLTVEELLQVVQICLCRISNCHFVLTAFK